MTRFLLFLFLILGLNACSLGRWGSVESRSYSSLKKDCQEEKALACRELGLRERHESPRLSSYYFRQGCTLGDSLSCDYLLRLSYFTREIRENITQFQRECRHKSDHHCFLLSRYYLDANLDHRAEEKLHLGCQSGDFLSCHGLTQFYEKRENREMFFNSLSLACIAAGQTNWALEQYSKLQDKGALSCLLAGLRAFHVNQIKEAQAFYSAGCQVAGLSHRDRNFFIGEGRLYQMLSCSRSYVLADASARNSYLKDVFDISREYLRERCEFRLGDDPKSDCYDLSALYSLSSNFRASLHYLQRAVDQGLSNREHLLNDPEMRALRETPEFRHFFRRIFIE